MSRVDKTDRTLQLGTILRDKLVAVGHPEAKRWKNATTLQIFTLGWWIVSLGLFQKGDERRQVREQPGCSEELKALLLMKDSA